jgi:glycine/D-amino acid oxidase-like deaminating enzyme
MNFSEAKEHPDVEWWDKEQIHTSLPEVDPIAGLFVRSGIVVDCPAYLTGLWKVLQERGVGLTQEKIVNPNELSGYDAIIFTVGAGQNELTQVEHPPIRLIKGQSLELDWQNRPPLPFALNAGVQFSQISPGSVWAGATYERSWQTDGPTEHAEQEIRQKIAQFSPSFANLPLKSVWTSFRAATNDKKPFISHTSPNIYCLGGMGSKGLLYHAYMAKKLCEQLM